MSTSNMADTCLDCQERQASLTIRNRRLCAACFIRYVNSKILKRMESYRFKTLAGDEKRRLFLPISGGVSSAVLLQVLDAQLQRQIANRNRTAFDLVIARVVLPDTRDVSMVEGEYQSLAQKFPMHDFRPLVPLHDIFRRDAKIRHDLEHLGIRSLQDESDKDSMQRVFACATSVTTRADLEAIFLQRLLVAMAKEQDCESVIWGHSDSRLAALALADVAKGRGGSASSNIADGPSLHGITFNYPARDLFKVELQAYIQALTEPLPFEDEDDSTEQPLANIRNSSIDNLLRNYINQQGEKYPSIMANVVRTVSKLQVRNRGAEVQTCPFCVMPMIGTHLGQSEDHEICYGCKRMKQDIKTANV